MRCDRRGSVSLQVFSPKVTYTPERSFKFQVFKAHPAIRSFVVTDEVIHDEEAASTTLGPKIHEYYSVGFPLHLHLMLQLSLVCSDHRGCVTCSESKRQLFQRSAAGRLTDP